jgi:hypothetical protein
MGDGGDGGWGMGDGGDGGWWMGDGGWGMVGREGREGREGGRLWSHFSSLKSLLSHNMRLEFTFISISAVNTSMHIISPCFSISAKDLSWPKCDMAKKPVLIATQRETKLSKVR